MSSACCLSFRTNAGQTGGRVIKPSAALGVPNQAVSGGLCPTSQDPLDSVRELFSGFKDSMKAEFSSLNSID
jgi:hypothetical protein